MDNEDRYRAIAFARARAIAEGEKIALFFPGTKLRLVPTPAIHDHRRSWTALWLGDGQPLGSVRATDPVEAVDALLGLLARLVSRLGRGHAE